MLYEQLVLLFNDLRVDVNLSATLYFSIGASFNLYCIGIARMFLRS